MFARTLAQGERQFDNVAAGSVGVINGQDAFKLHDTFGFPIELTVELAREQGLSVDREGFEVALNEARQRSRRGARQQPVARTGLPPTVFLGYDELAAKATILRIFRGAQEVSDATDGEEVEVYLDRTPSMPRAAARSGTSASLKAWRAASR